MVDKGRSGLRGELLDLLVQAQIAGEGLLVGGDDVEATGEPGGVVGSDGLVRGAVQDDGGVSSLGGGQGGSEGVEGEGLGRSRGELVLPRGGQGCGGGEEGARVGDGNDGNLLGLSAEDLANELGADETDTDNSNVDNHDVEMEKMEWGGMNVGKENLRKES